MILLLCGMDTGKGNDNKMISVIICFGILCIVLVTSPHIKNDIEELVMLNKGAGALLIEQFDTFSLEKNCDLLRGT